MKTIIAVSLLIIAVFVMSVSPALAVFRFHRFGWDRETWRPVTPDVTLRPSLDVRPGNLSLPRFRANPVALGDQSTQPAAPRLETTPGKAFGVEAPPVIPSNNQASSSEFLYEKKFTYVMVNGIPAAVPEPSGLVALAAPVLGAMLYWKRRRNC